MEPPRINRLSPPPPSTASSLDALQGESSTQDSTAASEAHQSGTTPWPDYESLGQAGSEEVVRQLMSHYKSGSSPSGTQTSGKIPSREILSCEPEPNTDEGVAKAADFHLALRRFAPFYTFGGGFEGDAASRDIPATQEGHGGHTTDPEATARLTTVVSVQAEQVGVSSHCDMSRHRWLGEAQEIPTTFDKSLTHGDASGHIDVSHSGANPLLTSPDIDSTMWADYEVTPQGLHVSGGVIGDDFPAAEVLVADSAGNAVMLSEYDTAWGAHMGPYLHLLGEGKHLLAEFDATLPLDERGNFAMTCGAQSATREVHIP
jgi:hypothetical protein